MSGLDIHVDESRERCDINVHGEKTEETEGTDHHGATEKRRGAMPVRPAVSGRPS
jgi:hypothetical protein